jgi:hypothetical protein
VIMKVSRSMAPSSGLSQQSLRKVCPLGLESSVQQNSHIGLLSWLVLEKLDEQLGFTNLPAPIHGDEFGLTSTPPVLELLQFAASVEEHPGYLL